MLDGQFQELFTRWQNLGHRLENNRISLEEKYRQNNIPDAEKREIIKLLYHCGWLNTNWSQAEPNILSSYESDLYRLEIMTPDIDAWTQDCDNILL